MTALLQRVDFHSGLADPLDHACRWLRKAQKADVRVVVTGPAVTLQRFDQLLWTFDDEAFLPHRRWDGRAVDDERQPGAHAMRERTPIWLLEAGAQGDLGLLGDARGGWQQLNLGPTWAAPLAGVTRLTELVGATSELAQAGRERWRRHAAEGRAPQRTYDGNPAPR